MRPADSLIWIKTIVVMLLYAALTAVAHVVLISRLIADVPLSIAVAFTLVQLLTILLLVGVVFGSRSRLRIRERRFEALAPGIREKLAVHATTREQTDALRAVHRANPIEFERCFVEFMHSVRGAGTNRLSALAVDLGLVERWQRLLRARRVAKRRYAVLCLGRIANPVARGSVAQALADTDFQVRIDAARQLAQTGDAAELESAFRFAGKQPLLARALLAEDMSPFASRLPESVILQPLSGGDSAYAAASLDLVGAWKKTVALTQFQHLLRHENSGILSRAIQLMPYIRGNHDFAHHVLNGLRHRDVEVRRAAALTAGRLRLQAARDALVRCLADDDVVVRLRSAYGLAQLGSEGMKVLEDEVLKGNPLTSGAALEAIEKARLGQAESAGV